MNRIQQYLQNAHRATNETFAGADGFLDDDMYFTGTPEEFFGADGASAPAQQAAVSRSQPYILTVSNASNAAVSIDLFDAYTYLTNAGFSNGSLTLNNVTISSGIAGVTYFNLLSQSQLSPFSIGSTLISSQSGTTAQVLQTISLTTRDANGNTASKVLTPTLDPYQNQSGVIELKQPYRIDGFTRLTFTVFATTSVQFQFYPADNINIARGLGGQPVSKQFGSPKIIRPASR